VTSNGAGRRVAVVLSSPRAGSTWLSRMLKSHPELEVHGQITNDNHRLYLLAPMRSLNPFGEDPLAFEAAAGPAMPLRVRVLRGMYRNADPGRALVIATPSASAFVPVIEAAYPDARYVHLYRDPMDTVASFRGFMARQSAGAAAQYRARRRHGRLEAARSVGAHWFHSFRWSRLPQPGYLAMRPHGFREATRLPPLEFLAWYYSAYEHDIRAALAHVPGDRTLKCRYEDLVTAYEPTMTGLLEFMGVAPLSSFIEETAKTVRASSLGKHIETLSPTEAEELRGHLSRLGVELGPGERLPAEGTA